MGVSVRGGVVVLCEGGAPRKTNLKGATLGGVTDKCSHPVHSSRRKKTRPVDAGGGDMQQPPGDDEDEVYGSEYGHAAVYHEMLLSHQTSGWYEDGPEDEHAIEEEDDENDAVAPPTLRSPSMRSVYGNDAKVASAKAAELVPPGEAGLTWHAQVLADDFKAKAKDCLPDGTTLKPRRPLPHVRQGDFFSSLVRTDDGRHIFTGVLNGWPALTNLEVTSITLKTRTRLGAAAIKRLWNAGDAVPPALPTHHGRKRITGVRATLRAAGWSAHGWSAASPGFVFWLMRDGTLVYGESMLVAPVMTPSVTPPLATRVHFFSHRYAKVGEDVRDRLTYHCGVLLEWSHGEHASVVELAWMGGLGGYGGKSNWYDDRDEPRTALYGAMPGELKLPWTSSMSEVRVLDVDAVDASGFVAFLDKHTGPTRRFLDPTIVESSDVTLSHRTLPDILRYLLNYVEHTTLYSEQTRNCQTFACDLFQLLSGRHGGMEPVTTVLKPFYKPHLEWFLCDPPARRVA